MRPTCCRDCSLGGAPSRPVQAATSAPLIERSIERATGIVYNITGGKDLTLQVGWGWGGWVGRCSAADSSVGVSMLCLSS